jgi:aryl-alcohol dehydrogenase-like predicted oxidoreductase
VSVAAARCEAYFIAPALAQSSSAPISRPIPSTGEPLPVVGLSTAEVFDVADTSSLQKARAVVRALIDNGGKLIDTASTYGDAERVLGDAIAPDRLRDQVIVKLEQVEFPVSLEGARRVPLYRHHVDLPWRLPRRRGGARAADFVQFDYSIDDREAEQRILPLAAEVKAAVLTALPFGRGRLFRAVHGQGLLKCMHTSETAARVSPQCS